MANSQIDPFNSFQGALGAGATFLGEWRDIKNEGNLTFLFSGETTAPGTLSIEFSIDKVIVDSKEDIEVLDISVTQPIVRLVAGSFYRVRYVNGIVPLTTFRIQTVIHKGKNVGFTLVDFQDTLENIELNTSLATNIVVLAKAAVTGVVAGIETTVVSYTTPVGKDVWISIVSGSGQGNSKWRVFEAADWKVVRRIGAGEINVEFRFGVPGLKVSGGGVTIDVKVTHVATGRTPDFEATIFGNVDEG